MPTYLVAALWLGKRFQVQYTCYHEKALQVITKLGRD